VEAASMGARKAKANDRRMVLRLPDLDHSKSAVLHRLPLRGSRRVYQYAIEQFTASVLLGTRLAFNTLKKCLTGIHIARDICLQE
jgi:hypothetical protein